MKNKSVDINEQKPRKWLLFIFIIIAVIAGGFLVYKTVDIVRNQTSKKSIESYNAYFEKFKGTQGASSTVTLLDRVIDNNKKNENLKIEVVCANIISTNPDSILEMKASIVRKHYYEISFDYNDNKRIKRITINDLGEKVVINDEDKVVDDFFGEVNKKNFNSLFEMTSGLKNGFFVKGLVDNIINSNQKYSEKQIVLTVDNQELKTVDEMKEFRNGINDWTEYDVTLTYDDEGYVCDIAIETIEQE